MKKIKTIIYTLNKESNNMIANGLTKQLSLTIDAIGSTEKGAEFLTLFCREKLGFKDSDFRLQDGSGLSKSNQITPEQLSTLLTYIYSNKGSRARLGPSQSSSCSFPCRKPTHQHQS